MKDLTPKQRNIDYTYEIAYRNLAKVATKEILRAGSSVGVVTFKDFIVGGKNIQALKVEILEREPKLVGNILLNIDGSIVKWEDIPDIKKIEIYNYISLNRILR